MKAVLISIRPKGCEKILSGEKTIEVRKSAPKEVPFKAYIYCTKDRKNLLPIEHGKVLQKVNFWENTDAYYGFGKVIGEFVCDKVDVLFDDNGNPEDYMTDILPKILQETALSYGEFQSYVANRAYGKSVYGWHISQLKIYDKPKELSEFFAKCRISDKKCRLCNNCFEREDSYGRYYAVKKLTRPPQSWCYVEE